MGQVNAVKVAKKKREYKGVDSTRRQRKYKLGKLDRFVGMGRARFQRVAPKDELAKLTPLPSSCCRVFPLPFSTADDDDEGSASGGSAI